MEEERRTKKPSPRLFSAKKTNKKTSAKIAWATQPHVMLCSQGYLNTITLPLRFASTANAGFSATNSRLSFAAWFPLHRAIYADDLSEARARSAIGVLLRRTEPPLGAGARGGRPARRGAWWLASVCWLAAGVRARRTVPARLSEAIRPPRCPA